MAKIFQLQCYCLKLCIALEGLWLVSLTILHGFSSKLHRRVVWHSGGIKSVPEAKGITTSPAYGTFLVCCVLNPLDYKFLYVQIR